MRLIDADAMEQMMSDTVQGDIRGYPYSDTQWEMAFKWIDHQPTVDAVPVVRCGECKHSEPWYGDRSRCFLWAENGISVFNDGFCSYGEQKGGAEDG